MSLGLVDNWVWAFIGFADDSDTVGETLIPSTPGTVWMLAIPPCNLTANWFRFLCRKHSIYSVWEERMYKFQIKYVPAKITELAANYMAVQGRDGSGCGRRMEKEGRRLVF